jgi:hypothetical protein
MNKACGRKRDCRMLKQYANICLEGLGKIAKLLLPGSWTENRTQNDTIMSVSEVLLAASAGRSRAPEFRGGGWEFALGNVVSGREHVWPRSIPDWEQASLTDPIRSRERLRGEWLPDFSKSWYVPLLHIFAPFPVFPWLSLQAAMGQRSVAKYAVLLLFYCLYMTVYPEVSGLAAWSENCKWYSSLALGAVVLIFYESV